MGKGRGRERMGRDIECEIERQMENNEKRERGRMGNDRETGRGDGGG